ncbi:GNAT acetyltransferase 2-domain-containing protein [Chytridium lagenaria]|nr:GNAT acetyltransferase 2-domain-containing protein [Chytridium lagenaria]
MPGKGHTLSHGARRAASKKVAGENPEKVEDASTGAPSGAKPIRKKLDPRIPALITNGVQNHHRSFFILVARVSARPSVLWCYKKELGFSSHRKKRMNQIKRQIERGQRDADEDDPFELFISSTSIRYTYSRRLRRFLDFEALTPNLMARTIETVEDVHARYRTEAHTDTVARFNERFLLSLGNCDTCLLLDDELNVLPISAGRHIKALPRTDIVSLTPAQQELADLKASLADTQPIGSLVSVAKTLDQARAILTFVEAIAEKTLRTTVALTAARGRGKSAALGVAIGAAVAYGHLMPWDMRSIWIMILQSTNPEFQKAVVRVNIFRAHRQTIQYVQPTDYAVLAQAELLVIDEAAAIPLPIVKSLLGPYLTFMSSTINGYEGTASATQKVTGGGGVVVNRDGKERSDSGDAPAASSAPASLRVLREIRLDEPIRYANADPVESWLTKLLCLDACNPMASTSLAPLMTKGNMGCPHPSTCELFYVNRDTLFSFHPVSEAFLQRMMGLYVASHYKNSPNDLQLLSDAPAHHLFVLLPPLDKTKVTTLPEPLVVIQICMEGKIARGTALSSLAKGIRSSGDLIPWVVAQQFQDDEFASLSGARVVRIATHPDYLGMGYGAFALKKLERVRKGRGEKKFEMTRVSDEDLEVSFFCAMIFLSLVQTLQSDDIRVRDPATMPPLLLRLSERPPTERLHWLGVSYGLTPSLFRFWKRAGYTPVYLRQTTNELTGEHTSIMLKPLQRGGAELQALTGGVRRKTVDDGSVTTDASWVKAFSWDFRRRFIELLGFQFKKFPPIVVMSILEIMQGRKA